MQSVVTLIQEVENTATSFFILQFRPRCKLGCKLLDVFTGTLLAAAAWGKEVRLSFFIACTSALPQQLQLIKLSLFRFQLSFSGQVWILLIMGKEHQTLIHRVEPTPYCTVSFHPAWGSHVTTITLHPQPHHCTKVRSTGVPVVMGHKMCHYICSLLMPEPSVGTHNNFFFFMWLEEYVYRWLIPQWYPAGLKVR